MSAAGVGISEKVQVRPNFHDMKTQRFGYPTALFMKDVLQFDLTKDEAIDRAMNTRRTANMYFGVGDSTTDSFYETQYGSNKLLVYTDKNFPGWEEHP